MDKRLTYRAHVHNKINNLKKSLWKYHKLQGKVWGLYPRIALWIYTGIIRPALTHACMIWVGATRYKSIQDKLRSFQLLALRLLGFTRKSTPARGLEVITFTPPLFLYIRMVASQTHLRTQHLSRFLHKPLFSSKITFKSHRQWCNEFLDDFKFPYHKIETDRIIPKQNWSKNYKVSMNSMDKKNPKAGIPLDNPLESPLGILP